MKKVQFVQIFSETKKKYRKFQKIQGGQEKRVTAKTYFLVSLIRITLPNMRPPIHIYIYIYILNYIYIYIYIYTDY